MAEIIKIRVKQNPTVISGSTGGVTMNLFNSFTATTDTRLDVLESLTGATGSIYYTGATPSTVTVGGLSSGAVLTGRTFTNILQQMLVVYQSPAFGAFNFSGQSQLLEVGIGLSGSKTATWTTTNSLNISGSSISIRDVNSNILLVTDTTNDGTQSINIGTINNTSPISQSWRGEARNTNGIHFNSSNFTVSSIYPYFYGKISSGGAAAGANRPTITNSIITGGTKVVASSSGTITITYNSSGDDYVWFAIPSTSTTKTVWYGNALNNGTIGGAISAGGNLFPSNTTLSVTTVLWSGVSYKVFLANYQSEITSMEMRNS